MFTESFMPNMKRLLPIIVLICLLRPTTSSAMVRPLPCATEAASFSSTSLQPQLDYVPIPIGSDCGFAGQKCRNDPVDFTDPLGLADVLSLSDADLLVHYGKNGPADVAIEPKSNDRGDAPFLRPVDFASAREDAARAAKAMIVDKKPVGVMFSEERSLGQIAVDRISGGSADNWGGIAEDSVRQILDLQSAASQERRTTFLSGIGGLSMSDPVLRVMWLESERMNNAPRGTKVPVIVKSGLDERWVMRGAENDAIYMSLSPEAQKLYRLGQKTWSPWFWRANNLDRFTAEKTGRDFVAGVIQRGRWIEGNVSAPVRIIRMPWHLTTGLPTTLSTGPTPEVRQAAHSFLK